MSRNILINNIPVKTNAVTLSTYNHVRNIAYQRFVKHLADELEKGKWCGNYQKWWWIVPLDFREFN